MLGSILVAVSSERKVLFLDEPFGCLDPSNAEKLISFFQKLSASGVTVVITSHDLYQCVLLADDVYIIKNGNISWNCNDIRENKITVDELTKIYNDKA